MPWRKIFRVLGWVSLGSLLLLGIVVALGFYWAKIDRKSRDTSLETRIARELGWSEAENRDAVRARILREVRSVLPLLKHRSLEIRQAARRCLYRVPLDEPSLEFLFAELSHPRTTATSYAGDIVYLLCNQPDDGTALFAFFYKRPEPVPLVVQNGLEFQASKPFPPEAWPDLLLALVRDSNVPAAKRRAVLQIWSEMYLSNDRRDMGQALVYPPQVTALEELVPDLPAPVAEAARETIRRFQRVRILQRDWPLLEIDREIILSLRPPEAEAIAALSNDQDWRRTHQAALQLALNGVVDALPSLRTAADTHWYPPVRETARLAVEVLEGKHPELLQDGGEPFRRLIDRRSRERWEAWRSQHSAAPPAQATPGTFRLTLDVFVIPWIRRVSYDMDPLLEAWVRRLRPGMEKVEEVEYRWKESAPLLRFDWDLSPRHTLRFAGGKLLGYNEGEFGAGTIFIRRDEMPRLVDLSHVEGFVRMPFGIVIVCHEPLLDGGKLLLIRGRGEKRVAVEPFKQLPDVPVRFQTTFAGELLIDCGMNKVVITPAGTIRMANEREAKTWDD